MGTRLQLQTKLESILGSRQVYFQPPASISIQYPCIVYELAKMEADFANNKKYAHLTRYQVTTMVLDPDSTLLRDIFDMPKCSHTRHFVIDGLNHDIFDVYY